MRYEVVAGKHHDDEKTYRKGDVVTASTDLVKAFPGKFRKLESLPNPPEDKRSESDKGSSKGKAETNEKKPAEAADKSQAVAARGKEVTGKFDDKFADEGFKIFVRDKLYHVYEGDSTTPIEGGEGLAKDAVETAIAAYLEK